MKLLLEILAVVFGLIFIFVYLIYEDCSLDDIHAFMSSIFVLGNILLAAALTSVILFRKGGDDDTR